MPVSLDRLLLGHPPSKAALALLDNRPSQPPLTLRHQHGPKIDQTRALVEEAATTTLLRAAQL